MQLLLDITIIMKQMFLYKVQILRPKSKQKDNGHSLCVCDGLGWAAVPEIAHACGYLGVSVTMT